MKSILLNISILFYNLFLFLYQSGIRIASIRSPKAKQWITGRRNIFETIKSSLHPKEERVWIHCASLGEFEQGRTLIEKIKQNHPTLKIVLTFYSPSGYEIRKNYPLTDYVFYLPMDGKKNSRRFLDLIKPKLVIFVKYEFWYHYFQAIEKRKIPFIMISVVFHKKQAFFQWYGWLFQKMLYSVSHFFVQDNRSQNLLSKLDFGNSDICGDTRIDRVLDIAKTIKPIPSIEQFLNGQKAIIGGSTYLEESKYLFRAMKEGVIQNKVILVPHNVDENHILELMQLFGNKAIRYSKLNDSDFESRILIVDTIGILSSIYQYGKFALIGGGFGKSIHNILEPAAFSLPVFFGPQYYKFKEAHEMLASGAAFSFDRYDKFVHYLKHLESPNEIQLMGQAAKTYLEMNSGGTEKIYYWLTKRNLL